MPTAMEFVDSGKVSSGKTSSFTGTCSLLREYLREKGSVGDLSLRLSLNADATKGKPEMVEFRRLAAATMPKLEQQGSEEADGNPLALFPQNAGFGEIMKQSISHELPGMEAKEGSARSQMTIFYGGRMVIFDDIPAEKAEAIMQYIGNTNTTKRPPPTKPTNCGDLPLKRKASLQRFFENRKERLSARSPNKVNYSSPISTGEELQSEKNTAGPSEPTIPVPLALYMPSTGLLPGNSQLWDS